MADVVEELRERSGLDVVGAFAFGDSPDLQDELLDVVRRGTKRATAGSVAEAEAEAATGSEPFPAAGLHWGLLDGRGEPRFVMQTVEVNRGRMGDVTAAFAWDEGEHDRTREGWLEGHRRYFARQGIERPDDLEVLFERFRVVWPEADATVWLTDDVRELRWDERDWLRAAVAAGGGAGAMVRPHPDADVAALPGLVCERHGARVGALTFRPRPGGDTECVSIDALVRGAGVGAALTAGVTALGRRSGWRRVWRIAPDGQELEIPRG